MLSFFFIYGFSFRIPTDFYLILNFHLENGICRFGRETLDLFAVFFEVRAAVFNINKVPDAVHNEEATGSF